MTENPLLAAAKEYLANGFHPFPVAPRDKRPLVEWKKYQNEAPTVEQLDQWWTATPDANIGLPMGRGVFVLDIDGDEGHRALGDAGMPSDAYGVMQVSTGKGWHYYFKGDVPDRIGVLPKVDVRSAGGYVVAPPSVHASGHVYVWSIYTPWEAEIPPAPKALLEILARPTKPTQDRQPGSTSDPVLAWVSGVAEGGRDVACTRAAGKLLGLGLHADVVEALLQPGADLCDPPFDDVAKCVASIAARQGEVAVERDAPEGGAAIVEFIEKLLVPDKPRRVVSTGLKTLDAALNGGLYPGQATYFAGKGGVGKSITAQMLAILTAMSGGSVLYATLEMPTADVMARLVSYFTRIDSRRVEALFHGEIQPDAQDVRQLRGVVPIVAELPITFRQSWNTIAALDKAVAERPDTKLLVVDQLHHLAHDGIAGLEENSRGLINLAGKYDIPVIGVCQVNRPDGKDRRADWRPNRYSLRGSEQLYHDPAVVLLFHRTDDAPGTLEIQVAKGRMGGASDNWLSFSYRPEFCRVGS